MAVRFVTIVGERLTVAREKVARSGRLARLVRDPRGAPYVAAAGLLAVWQFAPSFTDSDLIPPPREVLSDMIGFIHSGTMVEQFGISLARFGVGFVAVMVVGTALGLMIGRSARLETATQDIVVLGLTFPDLIWALLIAMWIGYGNAGPIWVMFLAALPYVLLNVSAGVRNVPHDLLAMSHSFQISTLPVLRHVVLPSLAPFLFASMRYGIAAGWPALIGAEVFTAQSGAGYQMVTIRRQSIDSAPMIAWGMFFVILAMIVERIVFTRASRRVFRWRQVDQSRAGGRPVEVVVEPS